MRLHNAPALTALRARLLQQLKELEAKRLAIVNLPPVEPPETLIGHVASSAAAMAHSLTPTAPALPKSVAAATAGAADESGAVASSDKTPAVTILSPRTWRLSASVSLASAPSALAATAKALRESVAGVPAALATGRKAVSETVAGVPVALAAGRKVVSETVAGVPAALAAGRKAVSETVAGVPAALAAGVSDLGDSLKVLPAGLSAEAAKMAAEATSLVKFTEREEARFRAETAAREDEIARLEEDYDRHSAIMKASLVSYLEDGVLVKDAIFRRTNPYVISSEVFDETLRFEMSSLSHGQWQAEREAISSRITEVVGSRLRLDLILSLPKERPSAHRSAAEVTSSARGASLALSSASSESSPVATASPISPPSDSPAIPALSAARLTSLAASREIASAAASSAASSEGDELLAALQTRVNLMIKELNTEWHIPLLFDSRRACKKRFLEGIRDRLNQPQTSDTTPPSIGVGAPQARERIWGQLGAYLEEQLGSLDGPVITAGMFSRRTAQLIIDLQQTITTHSFRA